MRIRKWTAAAGVAGLLAVAAAAQVKPIGWSWPDSMEALRADPKDHKLLYEDENIRILELIDVAGKTVPAHTHPSPSLLLVDQDSKYVLKFDCTDAVYCNGGKPIDNTPSPETAYPLVLRLPPQGPHTVVYAPATDGNGAVFHAYRIEYKKLDPSGFKH